MARKGKATIIATIAAIVAVAALAVGISSSLRVSEVETTKELGSGAYSIGLLDDTTGKVPEKADESGLSTDKFYKLDGLKVEVAKNATVKYQEDKKFLTVQTLTYDYNSENLPAEAAGAKFVRIEIIPTDDDDNTVSWLEKSGYVEQLTVTVLK